MRQHLWSSSNRDSAEDGDQIKREKDYITQLQSHLDEEISNRRRGAVSLEKKKIIIDRRQYISYFFYEGKHIIIIYRGKYRSNSMLIREMNLNIFLCSCVFLVFMCSSFYIYILLFLQSHFYIDASAFI